MCARAPAARRPVSFSAVVGGQREAIGTAAVGADSRFTSVDPVGAGAQGAIALFTPEADVPALFDLAGAIASGPAGQRVSLDSATGAPASRTFFRADGSVGAVADPAGAARRRRAGPPPGDGAVVFAPGFGREALCGFTASRPDHDTLGRAASDFAGRLRRTVDVARGTVIHDPATGGALLVVGVSSARLRQHRGDIALP